MSGEGIYVYVLTYITFQAQCLQWVSKDWFQQVMEFSRTCTYYNSEFLQCFVFLKCPFHLLQGLSVNCL